MSTRRVRIIDSHTGGEPTRVVVAGGPDLGTGPITERVERWRRENDALRYAIVNEPRGSDVIVGALLVEPVDKSCVTGVIYFNNVGYLGMCGHGTIGLIVTLAHMGKIKQGSHRIETNVGIVTAELHADGTVSVENVPSYRKTKAVTIDVPGFGKLAGDLAWSGNWFFLVDHTQHKEVVKLDNISNLMNLACRVLDAANSQGMPEVDHIELFGPPTVPGAKSKSFVLCPGRAYDRSPCGTGTSAKLACLAADGKLAPGEEWIQESVIGSTFKGRYRKLEGDQIIPTITGSAHITAEAELIFSEKDPFKSGIGWKG